MNDARIGAIIASAAIFCLFGFSCASRAPLKDDDPMNEAGQGNHRLSVPKPGESGRVLQKIEPDSQGLPEDAESTIRGRVEERKDAKGTLSEYVYFVIVREDGKEWILFDADGESRGFREWDGKMAVIRCVPAWGVVGFRKTETYGLRIATINEPE